MALLIITTTLYVNSNFTVVTDPAVRKKQYIDSILFYMQTELIDSIIICDNSNYDFSQCEEIQDALKKYKHNKIEILHFSGDVPNIMKQGKGYGEGEIMAYIFTHSKLLQNTSSFFKVTGRVNVLNIDLVIRNVNPAHNCFQIMSFNPWGNVKKVESRFYHCTKATFSEHLLNAYKEVNDAQGYYLEHAYYDHLVQGKVVYRRFKRLPYFEGISGSTGETLAPGKLRWLKERMANIIINVFKLNR